MSWYKTKEIKLIHNNKEVNKIVKHDLDNVYLTDISGNITVYYDSNKIIDGKHVFIAGEHDDIAKKALHLKKNNFNITHNGAVNV